MNRNNPTRLIIFVKNPVPGEVKTRLAADIGPEKASEVYTRLLDHTQKIVRPLGHPIEVWYGNAIPKRDRWSEAGYPRHLQQGKDLGERMAHAMERCFAQGCKRVVLIGSDNLQLQTRHLETAFRQLKQYDTVLGPASDGGYYLIGLSTPLPEIFRDKAWSTDTVLTDTLQDLQRLQKNVFLLPQLQDIDRLIDLPPNFLDEGF